MERVVAAALPRSLECKRGEARLLAGAFVLLAALLGVSAANALFGTGRDPLQIAAGDLLASALYVLVAAIVAWRAIRIEARRTAWALLAAAVTLYGLGNIIWLVWLESLRVAPVPSAADVAWLAFYPVAYAGVVAMATSAGTPRPPAGVWLDGVIAGAGLAAIGAAAIFTPLLSAGSGGVAAKATEVAYPIGGLLLVAMVVAILAVRGWRIDQRWLLIGGSFLLIAVAHRAHATEVLGAVNRPSAVIDLVYAVAACLLAVAAWQKPPDHTRGISSDRSSVFIPRAFMFAAFALILYDYVHRLNPLAFGLAALTVVMAIVRWSLTFRDIRGLSEAQRLATTDDLTDLPNRRLFIQRVEESIAAARLSGTRLSVLMLDLDNFKQLNDTLGHDAGDALLQLLGPRIVGSLRATETVARLGGDEFAVLVNPVRDDAGVTQVAEKLLRALGKPFQVNGLALRVTGSVGIASFPDHARDCAELLKRADIAMYQAKDSRGGYEFYARERDTNSTERLTLAAELALALEKGAIEVHFQPQAHVRTRRIVGVEALVRWRRDDRRLVPPDEFVAAAEHAGLSRPLTRRVIDLALKQLQIWRAAGHMLHVAVNTTVADLLDTDFPAEVEAALAAYGLPAQALVLEVTENSVLSDPRRIAAVLGHLVELGVQLSLDDFGTGYSSLAHLRSLPVTEIKIDRSFVARICSDATDVAIVYGMIQLADKLGLRVVAEGVEDQDTWDALSSLDCELIQGYLVSRPLAASDLEPLLEAHLAPAARIVQRMPAVLPAT